MAKLSSEHRNKIAVSLSKETPELVTELRLLRDSMTREQLAEHFNISTTCLHRIIKRHNIELSESGRARAVAASSKSRKLSDTHKDAISRRVSKSLTTEQLDCIKVNLNTMPLRDITKMLGISYHMLHKGIKQLGLVVDKSVSAKFQAERSIAHIGKALEASKKATANMSAEARKARSDKAKEMWKDPLYRLKVQGGIMKTYAETDLKERLSIIGKRRFQDDPTVRQALFGPKSRRTSKLNDTVAMLLDEIGVEYEREFALANYSFDFKVGDILLEVNGEYWHNLPDHIRNDHAKTTTVERYYSQFAMRTIWESEVIGVNRMARLMELLNLKTIDPVSIDLTQLQFMSDPNPKDIRRFLSSYHYIGSTSRKTYSYAATLFGRPIAIACFGRSGRQNIGDKTTIELTRMCRHPQFHNKNLCSWFLGKCLNELRKLGKYSNVISYADLRYHNGTIYKATNWTDCGNTASDYCYMSNSNIPMHKKTLYNRAKASGMTERQYAEQHGYIKTKIGSKRKFRYDL